MTSGWRPRGGHGGVRHGPHPVRFVKDGWLLQLTITTDASGARCSGLALMATEAADPASMSTGLLRSIPVASLVEEAIGRVENWAEIFSGVEGDGASQLLTDLRRTRRRRNDDDLFFARIAATYVQLAAESARAPATALARQLDRSPEQVREHLRVARKRGLLTSPGKGARASSDLTDKARQLLKEASDQ